MRAFSSGSSGHAGLPTLLAAAILSALAIPAGARATSEEGNLAAGASLIQYQPPPLFGKYEFFDSTEETRHRHEWVEDLKPTLARRAAEADARTFKWTRGGTIFHREWGPFEIDFGFHYDLTPVGGERAVPNGASDNGARLSVSILSIRW